MYVHARIQWPRNDKPEVCYQVTDDTIEKLQALLPENLLLSAFDLVDREKGSCSPRVWRTSDTNVQYSYPICHSLGK